MCIIVANKEDVAAFKDYTPPADGAPFVPSSPSDTSQPISPPPADTPSVDYPEHTVCEFIIIVYLYITIRSDREVHVQPINISPLFIRSAIALTLL